MSGGIEYKAIKAYDYILRECRISFLEDCEGVDPSLEIWTKAVGSPGPATLTLPVSPPVQSTFECAADHSYYALFFSDDENLVTRNSSPTGLTASSTTLPPKRRHKSAFRARHIGSQQVVEQHTANNRKTVHFDNCLKKTLLLPTSRCPIGVGLEGHFDRLGSRQYV